MIRYRINRKALSLLVAAGFISCALLSQSTQAAGLISGDITFTGTVTLDTGSAGTATMVTGWFGIGGTGLPAVQNVDGDFATITPGDGVTFVAPLPFSSGAIPGFWSVDGFTFDLTSSAIPAGGQTSNSVTVDAVGTVSGNGFSPTPAIFSFTTQDPSADGLFSFSASASAVPEPGTIISFLSGSSLLGAILFIRRRRS